MTHNNNKKHNLFLLEIIKSYFEKNKRRQIEKFSVDEPRGCMPRNLAGHHD